MNFGGGSRIVFWVGLGGGGALGSFLGEGREAEGPEGAMVEMSKLIKGGRRREGGGREQEEGRKEGR